MHLGGFGVFRLMLQKLMLNNFVNKKINKMKIKYFWEIGGYPWFHWKTLMNRI